MDKSYELWHLRSGNLVGVFDTLEMVLDVLSDAAKDHGIDEVKDYAVLEYVGEESSAYAQTEELASLVERHMHAMPR
jgi:hypothetical protein